MMLIKRRVSSEAPSEKPSDQDMASNGSSKRKNSNGDVSKSTDVPNTNSKMIFILCPLLITLTVVTVNFYLSNQLQSVISQNMKDITTFINDIERQHFNIRKPVVSMIATNKEWPYLIHIREIFRRLGYEVVSDIEHSWDILWVHNYPPEDLSLKPHQKVNHFPGTAFVTQKVRLSTSNLSFVPMSFQLPGDKEKFLDFASKHSDRLWMRKNLAHRGVKIQKVEEMNLTDTSYFIQEFIENPFLIDGRKFDIGIYVILTSINPLRVYTFDEEAQFRFCTQNYYPFNPKNIASYVILDKYTPIWNMPSLNTSYGTNLVTRKESFNTYLKSIGKDPQPLWNKMEDMIAMVYKSQEKNLYNRTKPFPSSRHFFELTRFDFMIDENLTPYLLESNMSPNLATPALPPNREMFEKVIYNTLSLSGIARTDGIFDWHDYEGTKWNFRVNDRDIVVNEVLCSTTECKSSCNFDKCRTCFRCLSDKMKLHLKDAFLEQKSIWSAKRLIPSTNNDDLNSKTANNAVQADWFKAKCRSNSNWCSK